MGASQVGCERTALRVGFCCVDLSKPRCAMEVVPEAARNLIGLGEDRREHSRKDLEDSSEDVEEGKLPLLGAAVDAADSGDSGTCRCEQLILLSLRPKCSPYSA